MESKYHDGLSLLSAVSVLFRLITLQHMTGSQWISLLNYIWLDAINQKSQINIWEKKDSRKF